MEYNKGWTRTYNPSIMYARTHTCMNDPRVFTHTHTGTWMYGRTQAIRGCTHTLDFSLSLTHVSLQAHASRVHQGQEMQKTDLRHPLTLVKQDPPFPLDTDVSFPQNCFIPNWWRADLFLWWKAPNRTGVVLRMLFLQTSTVTSRCSWENVMPQWPHSNHRSQIYGNIWKSLRCESAYVSQASSKKIKKAQELFTVVLLLLDTEREQVTLGSCRSITMNRAPSSVACRVWEKWWDVAPAPSHETREHTKPRSLSQAAANLTEVGVTLQNGNRLNKPKVQRTRGLGAGKWSRGQTQTNQSLKCCFISEESFKLSVTEFLLKTRKYLPFTSLYSCQTMLDDFSTSSLGFARHRRAIM